MNERRDDAGGGEPQRGGRAQSETAKQVLARVFALVDRPGVNQDDFAQAAGLNSSRFSKWRRGEGEPTCDHVARIAAVSCVPVAYFFGEVPAEAAKDLASRPPAGLALDRNVRLILELLEDAKGRVSPEDVVRFLFRAIQNGAIPSEPSPPTGRTLRMISPPRPKD